MTPPGTISAVAYMHALCLSHSDITLGSVLTRVDTGIQVTVITG